MRGTPDNIVFGDFLSVEMRYTSKSFRIASNLYGRSKSNGGLILLNE
jgi:hypothetical protein